MHRGFRSSQYRDDRSFPFHCALPFTDRGGWPHADGVPCRKFAGCAWAIGPSQQNGSDRTVILTSERRNPPREQSRNHNNHPGNHRPSQLRRRNPHRQSLRSRYHRPYQILPAHQPVRGDRRHVQCRQPKQHIEIPVVQSRQPTTCRALDKLREWAGLADVVIRKKPGADLRAQHQQQRRDRPAAGRIVPGRYIRSPRRKTRADAATPRPVHAKIAKTARCRCRQKPHTTRNSSSASTQ